MQLETRGKDGLTEIVVQTEKPVALVVETSDSERIYLPGVKEESNSTYYLEQPESLEETSEGYKLLHKGGIENITVLGGD